MRTFIRPRLRKPLGIALAGTVFATAWALRGDHAWWLSVAMEVTVLVSAVRIRNVASCIARSVIHTLYTAGLAVASRRAGCPTVGWSGRSRKAELA